MASAMLLPIGMVLDLRRILIDYDMVSASPPPKELGVRGMFDGREVVKFEASWHRQCYYQYG